MFEEQGKISRMPKIAEKACNDNFRVLSAEAKKNLDERYYYENNLNQWQEIFIFMKNKNDKKDILYLMI